MPLFVELQRRNIFRVGIAYIASSWLLIQVVETIFPLFGFSDTPARVVVVLLSICFIPALIFTWVFELTPEGLKRESEINRSESITALTGKKLDRAIIVVLAIALVYFSFDKFVLSTSRFDVAREQGRQQALTEKFGKKSIAVLPFVDMSPSGDQDYMSVGIAEELLNLLADVRGLRVISRSSSFSYKDKSVDIPTIAEELNVDHILEGSVRKSEDSLRITTQLIDARTDSHIWSQTYDVEILDVFSVQDQIAESVVKALKVSLLGDPPKSRAMNPEAYALFLQGRYLGELVTVDGNRKAIEIFTQVIEIEPGHAPSWIWLATAYYDLTLMGAIPVEESLPLMRNAAQQALLLEPENGEAYSALGYISAIFDGDLEIAAKYMQRALELAPTNLQVIRSAAIVLNLLGRYDDAIRVLEYVANRDPVSTVVLANLAATYLHAGRWQNAQETARNALRLNPNSRWLHLTIADTLFLQGKYEQAMEHYLLVPDEASDGLAGRAATLFALGDLDGYESHIADLRSRFGTESPYSVAFTYAHVSEIDAAFEWLEKQVALGDASQLVEVYYAPLVDDPRWTNAMRRLGRSKEQLAAIDFDVRLPE